MLRNQKRLLAALGAALLAAAPALHAQSGQPVRGDVDGDGRVTAADARIVSDWLVGRPVPPGANVAVRGDVNGDGRVTAIDAAIIARAAAGRDVSRFPVGKELPAGAVAVVECAGSLRTATVSCGEPGSAANGRRDLIVGGQNVNVKLTSANIQKIAPDTFQFTVTVQNLLAQAMAVDSGTGTPNPNGVRVFFASGPNVTGGSGTITVANPDGMGTFLAANQNYFQYATGDLGDGVLAPQEISSQRTWKLQYTGEPDFSFLLFLSTPVQFPAGWVDIYPPNNHPPSPTAVYADTVQAGTTLQLQDTIRNGFGGVIPGPTPTWSNTAHGHATVNGSGLVSAASSGVDTVTATNGPRSGRVVIVVAGLSADSTTITANPTSMAAGDTSLITVQVRDEFGHNVTTGGATVSLTTNLGTLVGATTGTTVNAVDQGNGTYTAKLTHTGTGTATVTGTLNGNAIGDNATVAIGPGTPANMTVHSANPQTGTAGMAAGSPPGVKVTDTHGNPVAGVAVLFTVTAGGGTVSNGGPAGSSASVNTDASGFATLTTWTLGTTAGTSNNTIDATSPGLPTVTFTASADPGAPANIAKNAGDGQSAVVNTNVATAPQVKITDTYGNVVPGVSVTFAPASGGGSVTGGSQVTDAGGLATVGSWKLGTAVGANTLTATAGALNTTFNATATPDVPAIITKTSTDPQTGTVGVAVGSPPAVHVTDQFNNPTPGITVNFVVIGGGGSTTGASPSTNASGNATIGSWTPGSTAPGPNQLSATAVGGSNPADTFTVYVPPVANNDSSQAMGNTNLGSPVAPNVLSNDAGLNGAAISFSTPTEAPQATVRGGSITLHAGGTFDYTPPAGNVLRDSLQYTITDGQASASAYIKIRFVGRVWYVDGSGPNGDGRSGSPFNSIANAEVVTGAVVNDSILVRNSTVAGGTLKNGQLVYGQGTTAFTTTLNGSSVTLLATGSKPSIGALTLGSGNTLRSFTNTGGITGSGFGTLTVVELGINNSGGQALSLTNGTLAGDIDPLISGGGTNNVLLSNVSTASTRTLGASGNALTGATGDAVVVTAGSGSFTFPGDVARGISVTNNTGGTVTFSGTKNINSGTAAGVTITGNAAAVNVAFTGGALTIATTTGTPFTATGAGVVTVAGSSNTITATGAAANVVNLSGITLGASGISFSSINSSGTPTGPAFSATNVGNTSGSSFTASSLTVAGTSANVNNRGLALTTNSAPFTFTTVSINGTGGEGIYLNGNTGAVAVNGGTVGNTSSTTGDALAVSGGNAAITVAASLTKSSAGRIANIGSHTAGAVSVSGALSCTGSCTGIVAGSNSGGSITFSSGTQTLTTGASAAVSLTSNTGATIDFTGGTLAITTTSGAGFSASGGGTVTVTGANNTVNSSGGGTAVNVSSTTIGANGMTFKRVDATGSGTNGIVLSSTGSGAFTVTGDGASDEANTTRGRTTAKSGGGTLTLGSGGSISGRSGHGVSLSSTGAVTLRNMVVTGNASSGDGINANTTGRLTIDNTRVTGAPNDHGLWGSSVSGLAIHHSEIDNNATTVGVVEGPDIWNVRLLGLTGTDSIRNSNIHHSQEDVLGILNSSGTLNLTVLNTNITDTGTGAGGTTAFVVSADGTANVTLNLQNDSILRGRARGVDFGTGTASSAVLNTTINNSQFHQNGAAISVVQGSSGTNTFSITNNNLQSNDANSLQAMIINRAGSPSFNGFGLFTGTISGNTIGTTGVANSGSGTSSGIEVESNGSGGATRVALVNNTIRQVATHGIQVSVVDGNTGGTTPPTVEARVQGNNISVLNPIGLDGINILTGALNTDDVTMCVDIISNTSTGIRNGLRVRGSGAPTAPATVQLEGWDGVTARATYFANRPNTLSGGIAAYNDNTPSAPGGYVAVANCNTP